MGEYELMEQLLAAESALTQAQAELEIANARGDGWRADFDRDTAIINNLRQERDQAQAEIAQLRALLWWAVSRIEHHAPIDLWDDRGFPDMATLTRARRAALASVPDTTEETNQMSESDLIMSAWGLIANAGEGSWDRESDEWRAAAERWRDDFHAWLPDTTEEDA